MEVAFKMFSQSSVEYSKNQVLLFPHEERPLQTSSRQRDSPLSKLAETCGSSLQEVVSLKLETFKKISEMLHEKGFPKLKLQKGETEEHSVDCEQLELAIAQLLEEISKLERPKGNKDSIELEFSPYTESEDYTLKQKVRDLNEIIKIKERELSLCYTTINELRIQLNKKYPPSSVTVISQTNHTKIEKCVEELRASNNKLLRDNQRLTVELKEAQNVRTQLELRLNQMSQISTNSLGPESTLAGDELAIFKLKCSKLEDYNRKLCRDVDILRRSRIELKEVVRTTSNVKHRSVSTVKYSSQINSLKEQLKKLMGVESEEEIIHTVKQIGELKRTQVQVEKFIKELISILRTAEGVEIFTKINFNEIIEKSLPILKQWATEREEYKRLLVLRSELSTMLYGISSILPTETQMLCDIEEVIRIASGKT